MLTVYSPGKPFTLPSSWTEITLKQYLQLGKSASPRAVLECLASDVDALHSLPDETADYQLIDKLAFLKTPPNFLGMDVPTSVLGVVPPTEIGAGTLLQKWDAERWLANLQDEHAPEDDEDQPDDQRYSLPYTLAAIPLLSIYLSPLLTGKRYSGTDLAETVIDQIEALPCTEALPLTGFFLSRIMSQKSSGLIYLVEDQDQPVKKKKLAFLLRSLLTLKRILRLRPLRILKA